MQQEELISLAEAAAISGLSMNHLGLLARRGTLRARKIGRNWITSREAVAEYLARRRAASSEALHALRRKVKDEILAALEGL